MRYEITQRFLTAPSKRRSGIKVSPAVRFLVAHDTGNPDSTAEANVRYYENSRNQMSASAHLFVDDREIIECIPALTAPPEKAWHVLYGVDTDDRLYGVDANDAALGIEYCYGSRIDADEAYNKYVWVTAYALHKFDLDPDKDIVGHYFLDPHRRSDPITGLAHSRRSFDQFLLDVRAEYKECRDSSPLVSEAATAGPHIAVQKTATTRVRLNIRKGRPSTRAPRHQTVAAGTKLAYSQVHQNGEAVNGNAVWLHDQHNDYFFWSGGVTIQEAARVD